VATHVSFSANDANDGVQSSARIPPPPSSKRRIKREIKSLEKELKSLSDEYLDISNEVKRLSDVAAEPVQVAASDKKIQLKPRSAEKMLKEKEREPQRPQQEPEKSAWAMVKNREPKQWWIRKELVTPQQSNSKEEDLPNNTIEDDSSGSIIPFDLSVNHLQRISRVPGSNSPTNNDDSSTVVVVPEEFLPVVLSSEVDFRWRSRARANSMPEDVVKTTAYRIVARHSSTSEDDNEWLWDSGRVTVSEGLPDVVPCTEPKLTGAVGAIIEWRVTTWDSSSGGDGRPYSSEWTKFAIGPTQSEWQGQWISHPIDLEHWSESDAGAFWGNNKEGHQDTSCRNWEKRSQLPIFRAKLPALESGDDGTDEIASALLVVSGLGSFRASLDGMPLSSSGPLDPPLTDFAQRVSYRGFDVTDFLTGRGEERKEHVVGISMGSVGGIIGPLQAVSSACSTFHTVP